MAQLDHATDLTLKLISALLTDVSNSNDDLRGSEPTPFDAISCPDMSVYSYLARIRKYTKFDRECFPIALVYLMRLRAEGPMFAATPHNVHRLLITALLLASKASDDIYHTNSFMAQCGGIRVHEINHLELEMCTRLRWKMQVDADEFESVERGLRLQSAELRDALLSLPAAERPHEDMRRTPSTASALGGVWSSLVNKADGSESPPRNVSPRCVIGGSDVGLGGSEVGGEVCGAADLADLPPCKRGASVSRPSSFGAGLNLLAGKGLRTQLGRWVPGM